ncbi:hypothetical protein SNE40_008812 [Patella caerulea]|uniref:Apple domain-containing protein n=1 Tax=Patella caerulea TaxID=87958 RepID=A0AAN8JVF0_PATCE
MFLSLCLVFYLFQCILCFTKYRLLNVDIFYDKANSKMVADNKLLCALECMEVKLDCASFAYHEDRKTCYFYNFKLQPEYVNISDPGLFTYVDVEEDPMLHQCNQQQHQLELISEEPQQIETPMELHHEVQLDTLYLAAHDTAQVVQQDTLQEAVQDNP